ncbi:site-specific DNA-methyltransferase [Patescibacteria group bacterium]|nr:site-specific DNA-methyltransferase [Patescibacteria group bacterium]
MDLVKPNQFIKGNVFKLLPQIEDSSIDLIFTDPPYVKSLAELYTQWNQNLDFRVLAWYFNQNLKSTGRICLFADFATAVEIQQEFSKYFRFNFFWVWEKPLGQPVGQGKKQPISNCELLLVFSKNKAPRKSLTFNHEAISTPGEPYRKELKVQNKTRKTHQSYETVNTSGLRYPKQVLQFPSKCNLPKIERTEHPAQKPLALCKHVIKALSNPGDTVFDPFAGSGSILVAAEQLNRQYVGFEINPEYYNEALPRFKQPLQKEGL